MHAYKSRLFVGTLITASITMGGCKSFWTPKEEELPSTVRARGIEKILESEDRPKIVGEVAAKIDGLLAPIEYQYFGLLTGLADTGGDTQPSPQREIMLREMRAEGVSNPSEVMKSKDSAVVKLRAVCLPGSRENDLVDVLVELSSESDATSLQNGNLLPARLREVALLGGKNSVGFEKARAQGPVVILPKGFTTKDEIDLKTGLILGGARLLQSRMLGIRIRDTFAHVMTSSQVARAINDRFYLYDRSERRGAATPKDDDFVQIEVHPRYRYDTVHYIDTILSVPFLEKKEDRSERLSHLQKMLLEPTTTRNAALQLEAIGESSIEMLKTGLANTDPKIQFHSAYSLAYLGDDSCVPVLAALAQHYPELRSNCLIGLTIIEESSGHEALEELLQSSEPEVRYGAFNALYRQNPRDPIVVGEKLGDITRIVQVASQSPAVIVSLRDRPEILIFGNTPIVAIQSHVDVNPRLIIRPDTSNGKIRIVRFELNAEEIAISTDADLRSIVNGMYRVGATYSDMVQLLDECHRRGYLTCPLAIDPRPGSERLAERMNKASKMDELEGLGTEEGDIHVQDKSEDESRYAWWDVRRLFTSSTKNEEELSGEDE
jgi:flagellar basal body P-ring protein FlgI